MTKNPKPLSTNLIKNQQKNAKKSKKNLDFLSENRPKMAENPHQKLSKNSAKNFENIFLLMKN